MIKYVVVLAAVAGICSANSAEADELGIGVGPRGVTVGEVHGDRDRVRDRGHRGRDETAVIRNESHRDRDHDRTPIIINRD